MKKKKSEILLIDDDKSLCAVVSHQLKGMGGQFGHPEITGIAGSIQSGIDRADYGQAAESLESLRAHCDSLGPKGMQKGG